jgi:hypothetical protein
MLALHATGSQWDDALKVLSDNPETAILMNEPNKTQRDRLKSTLQTIATNRGLHVQVRNQNAFVYAWCTDEPGRFPRHGPQILNDRRHPVARCPRAGTAAAGRRAGNRLRFDRPAR